MSGLNRFWNNIKTLPRSVFESVVRHDLPTSDRTRSQTVFTNFFLHIHSTRVHPHTLRPTTTLGLGVALISLFLILTVTGILLTVYYQPSIDQAYNSIKDIHYVVPTGRFLRNIHRWAAQLMVLCVILHMSRVFYTAAYKGPRKFNWVLGMVLLVLTLALSFTGYLLPWDQLAYWAITIGANIAASPNELVDAMGLPASARIGDVQRELLLGSSTVGQDSLTRFYVLHVLVLPVLMVVFMAVHMWRIRKDGGMARPEGSPSPAGRGVGVSSPVPQPVTEAPTRTYGLMCVVRDRTPAVGMNPDETVSTWPHLLRSELFIFMLTMFVCLALGLFLDAPLKEPANAAIPENPAKAPWYFLGLQEMVSYSAFIGGVVIPAVTVIGLTLIPYLDREPERQGVWFSGAAGRRTTIWSAVFGVFAAVMSVAIPVKFGWLRNWFPDIPQLAIIIINPGSLLTVAYMLWSLWVMKRKQSTRLGAIALFTCFLSGFVILTYVGTYLRGPNWDFYWSQASWPRH